MGIIGTAPNQTYERTDGVRTGAAVNQQAQTAGVKNTAALADVREQDMTTALNVMLMKNGGNQPSANLPMNTYRHTGCGDGVADTDYATVGQLNSAINGLIESGSVTTWFQAAAPTGWTQVTIYNDYALRVVNSTGGGTGGSVDFTTAFASRTPTGTVGNHTLTAAEMPTHSHGVTDPGHNHSYYRPANAPVNSGTGSAVMLETLTNTGTSVTGISIQNAGSGGAHNHTWAGDAMSFAVRYLNIVLASKD